MPAQKRVRRAPSKQREAEPEVAKTEKATHEYTDELLAEIDETLAGMDTDTATKYRQKGGQ